MSSYFGLDTVTTYEQLAVWPRTMITLDPNDFLTLIDDLGYYEDDRYDNTTDFFKQEHNMMLSQADGYYILIGTTPHKETIFKLKYSQILSELYDIK